MIYIYIYYSVDSPSVIRIMICSHDDVNPIPMDFSIISRASWKAAERSVPPPVSILSISRRKIFLFTVEARTRVSLKEVLPTSSENYFFNYKYKHKISTYIYYMFLPKGD